MDEKPIDSFIGEYRFLSNFFPVEITLDVEVYPTLEHAFQAAKTLSSAERAKVRNAKTPGMAKRLGRQVTLRPDWETSKLSVMYDLVHQKFSKNPVLRADLLETGDRPLIEGNYWKDFFWGVCNGKGENHLGKILMRVRKELR